MKLEAEKIQSIDPSEEKSSRLPYSTPKLTPLGPIQALVQSGGGAGPDGNVNPTDGLG